MTRQLNLDYSGFDYESPVYRFGPLETQANNCLCSPIVYGEVKAAGNKIWQSSGESNFKAIVCFADGVISGFSDVKINDYNISDVPNCTYNAYVGNGTQNIDSCVPGSTNADRAAVVGGLKNDAYLALSITAGSKVSKNYLNVTCKLKGKLIRVYEAINSYETKYSNNPAWCIFDFLTCYNGCGLGLDSNGYLDNAVINSKIDIQSFIDAADYCDEKINLFNATGTVSVTSGKATVTGLGTKFLTEVKVGEQVTINSVNKTVTAVDSDTSLTVDSNYSSSLSSYPMEIRDTRFALNIILDQRKRRLDWFNDMLICCRANLVYNSSGKLALKIEQDASSVQSFTKEDILVRSEVFWTSPKEKNCDILKIQYIDPSKDYTRIYAPAEADTFSNNPPLIQEIRAYGVTSFKQASRLAWFYLNQAKLSNKFISFKTTQKALDLTPGDVIDITSSVLNYTNKKMRVVRLLEAQEGYVQIICREYSGGDFATLTTSLAGDNNDLTYTSQKASTDANNITVTYVDPGQDNYTIDVTVVGSSISVNLGTDAIGVINSTANEVITAIEQDNYAPALLSVALASGNDGTGLVSATTMMNLSGGKDGIYADTLGSVAPTINVESSAQGTFAQRAVTKVIAANNTADKSGTDKIIPDGSTSAEDVINEAINEIELNFIEAGSISAINSITSTVPIMTSNTTPSGTVSASTTSASYTNDVVPTMTSNTTPSGTVSASSIFSATYDCWKAFNDTYGKYESWLSASGSSTGWIQYQFTSSKIIAKYTIRSRNFAATDADAAPKNWILKGSDNGTTWDNLDTQTNETGWSLGETRTYTFTNVNSYTYYRLDITANNGYSYIVIDEIEFMESAYDSWQAFNGTNNNSNDCWKTSSGNTTGWLQYQFTEAKTITHYSITSINDNDQTVSPKSWTLQRSDDGTNWVDLHTQSNITSWSQNESKVYAVNNSTAYPYYRINVTENNGHANYLAIGELKLADSTASLSITFDNSANTTDEYYSGLYLKFTSGDCSGESGLISDYDGSTKVATVSIFSTLPSVSDNFEIQAYNARISLLEGTYIIDGSINLKSGIKLEGQGAGTVIKLKDSTNADVNLIEVSSAKFLQIANLYIDGNSSNQSSGNQVGISMTSVQSSTIRNILLNKLSSAGIKFTNCNNNIINSNMVTNITAQGINLTDSSSITIQNNNFNKVNSTGIYLSGTTSSTICGNCCIYSNAGILVDSDSDNNTLSGNTCNNNSTKGIEIKSSDNNSVNTNTCTDNDQEGIVFDGSDNNTVTGNTCCGNGKGTNNAYPNIMVKNDSDYNNLQSNTCRSASSGNLPNYGLRIDDNTCDKNIASNNDLVGVDAYGSGTYSDQGVDTVATNNRT